MLNTFGVVLAILFIPGLDDVRRDIDAASLRDGMDVLQMALSDGA